MHVDMEALRTDSWASVYRCVHRFFLQMIGMVGVFAVEVCIRQLRALGL